MWGNVHRRAEFTVIGQYSVYKSGILITFTMVYDHHLSLQSFLKLLPLNRISPFFYPSTWNCSVSSHLPVPATSCKFLCVTYLSLACCQGLAMLTTCIRILCPRVRHAPSPPFTRGDRGCLRLSAAGKSSVNMHVRWSLSLLLSSSGHIPRSRAAVLRMSLCLTL